MIELTKLQKYDKVAILSPSSGLAGALPWVLDQGLERLQTLFGLIPIEFPTTRMTNASPEQRAKDINEAFADKSIKAILTTLGGDDQIKLLKYLDIETILNNPKPFFGFSDNTNLVQLLWKLGIPSYYGGAIMTQFAMQKEMDQITIDFINHALFDQGEYKMLVSESFTDVDLDWSDKENLNRSRKKEVNDGWYWDGQINGEGLLWGGCVETMVAQLSTNRFIPSENDLKDIILFLETAEDVPEHWIIEYVLIALGERGILKNTKAVLIGRPKAWALNKQLDAATKEEYRKQQREIVINTIREYNSEVPIVQNIDFGHTDPQIVLPVGQLARVDSLNKSIHLTY